MKFTDAERKAIMAGDGIVLPRRGSYKPAKIGDAFEIDGRYYAVCSINRQDDRWHIRFEQVGAWAMPAKKPTGPDPLTGLRDRIANGEIGLLTYPADKPCPVQKGDRLAIRSWLAIEITKVARKIVRGKGTLWRCEFTRHEADRPQLLRRVPSGLETPADQILGMGDIERARRDGNYTTSTALALADEPESVGPDWIDLEAKQRRETWREKHERELERRDETIRRQLTRAKRELPPEERADLLARIEDTLDSAA